jgi:hypothetical protein
MNQFIPVIAFLRKRLARRSFDNVKDLVNCCSSNDWSQDRFARGLLKRCSSVWRAVPLGNQDAGSSSRSRGRLRIAGTSPRCAGLGAS